MSLQDDLELQDDLGAFRAALHARHIDLELPPLQSIVLAPDGSNQDPAAKAFARALAERSGAKVHSHFGERTAAALLSTCAERSANLLVLPVPYGRDIAELKDESLGSVVDMLIIESKCPILCVRQPMDEGQIRATLSDVILPVNLHEDQAALAAGWAFRILGSSGELEVLAVADRDVIEEARRLLGAAIEAGSLQAEALRRVVTHEIAGLISACQRRGVAAGLGVRIEVKVGRPAQVVLEEANKRPRLIAVAAPEDHSDPAYHHAADMVLGARGPVLVI